MYERETESIMRVREKEGTYEQNVCVTILNSINVCVCTCVYERERESRMRVREK